jgi:hypothetical protein
MREGRGSQSGSAMGPRYRKRSPGASHQYGRAKILIAICAYSISVTVSLASGNIRNEEFKNTLNTVNGTMERRNDGTLENLFQDLGQMEEGMLRRKQKVEPTIRTVVQKEMTGKALIIKDFRKFHKVIPFDQVQEQISLLSLSLID